MSSYQKFKIFIVNKKNVNQVVILTNIVCIGSSNHIFFHCYISLLCITFFCREVSSNKYHYCAIFVQSFSAYATTDRSKKRLVRMTFIKEACHEFVTLVSE